MIDLRMDFQERVDEVDAFIQLVASIERSVREGTPVIHSATGQRAVVSPLQQRLLYAGVYLHLYNLVEATVSRCIAAVEAAASGAPENSMVGDLSLELRKEWVRSVARTHEDLNTENRLKAALELCRHLVEMLPVKMKIAPGGGGNWDDEEIHVIAKRLGVALQLREETQRRIKRPHRDGRGALQLIKYLRNQLAHGAMSFSDCGDGHTAEQLEELKQCTVDYLSEVITSFEGFINRHEYLLPAKRPLASGG